MIRVFRVLAPNPGPFTLEGTNTWIVGWDPCAVIDPGPEDPEHLRAVARAARNVGAILVTHGHPDHVEGAAHLAELLGGVPVGVEPPVAEPLKGAGLAIRAVPTPGHTADSVSFHVVVGSEQAVLTGDTILGLSLAAYGSMREALRELRLADGLFTAPKDRDRLRQLIASMRQSAPDSLREMFRADSLALVTPR